MTIFKYLSPNRVVGFLLPIVMVCLSLTEARGQARDFGLGVILGEPTGISAKNWINRTTAFDFAVAWSFEGEDSFTFHADYLIHRFDIFNMETGTLPLYYGFGGRLKFEENDSSLGARFPIGLNYHFQDATLDMFLEIVPVMQLVPETDFKMNGAIGVRYFFESPF